MEKARLVQTPRHPDGEVHYITAEETYPVRGAVLRPGLPREAAVFPEDRQPGSVHLGAFHERQLVGVASLNREAPPVLPDGAEEDTAIATRSWRLRGMATLPAVRGQGYGKALAEACLRHVEQQGGALLWCNARTGAASFYRKLGFETVGEEFVIPTVGPHFLMWYRLAGG